MSARRLDHSGAIKAGGTSAQFCARCRVPAALISYGKPGPETLVMIENGEGVLGGCCIDDNSAAWHCAQCSWNWGIYRADLANGHLVPTWVVMLDAPTEYDEGNDSAGRPCIVADHPIAGGAVRHFLYFDPAPQSLTAETMNLMVRSNGSGVALTLEEAMKHIRWFQGQYAYFPRALELAYDADKNTISVCRYMLEQSIEG